MRGETPLSVELEIQGKGFFGDLSSNISSEESQSPKNMASDLKLDKENLPNFVVEKSEEKVVTIEVEGKKIETVKEENINPEVRRIELNNKIRQELAKIPKDIVEDSEALADKFVFDLGLINEDEQETARRKLAAHLHVRREYKRFESYNSEEKEKIFRELAIQDAEWLQKIGNRIKSIKENEDLSGEEKKKKINNTWREIKEIYSDNAEFFKKLNTEYREYNIGGDGFEGTRSGILGQIAAEELFGLVSKYMEKHSAGEIIVKQATSEEDVDKKTDLFIEIRYKNGMSRTIPCQVKAPEFKSTTQDSIKSGIIDVVLRTKKYEDKKEKDLTSKQKKIQKFRKFALDKYGIGFYITIPEGKAEEAVKSTRSKKGKINRNVINLLEDDGTVADDTKKRFFMEIGSALGLDILMDRDIINKLNLIGEEENKKKGGKKK